MAAFLNLSSEDVPAPEFHNSEVNSWFGVCKVMSKKQVKPGVNEMALTKPGREQVRTTWEAVAEHPHAVRRPPPIPPGHVMFSNPLHPHRTPPIPMPATRAAAAQVDKVPFLRRIMFFSFGRQATAEHETIFCPGPWHPSSWSNPNPTLYETQRLECWAKGVTWYSVHGNPGQDSLSLLAASAALASAPGKRSGEPPLYDSPGARPKKKRRQLALMALKPTGSQDP